MKNFDFGIKLWSSETLLLEKAEKLIDEGIFSYVEVILNPDFLNDEPFLEHKIPYVVHVPHENFGVSIGDEPKREYTLKMVHESIRWADRLDARLMILHAGVGSVKVAKSTLSEIHDERLTIENMPVLGIHGEKCLGYDAESISNLINNAGLCLDFGHAVKASISLKEDYRKIVSGFLKLKPRAFHISDGDLRTEVDQHLNIGEGGYDFSFFKQCVESNEHRYITIETPRCNPLSLDEDLANVKRLLTLWE